MRYGSVCSGIEAASVAWLPLGWRCEFMSEIEAFPRAVLKHHYPEVPLHGDFRTIKAGDYGPIDVLVGGTPCQSFSIAGLRGGIADDRGNLALEYLRLVGRLRPRFILWENVPGVLSSLSHDAPDPCQPPDDMEEGAEWVGEDEYDSDESHAFGCFLAGLSELGYGWAYRVFDAQYAGLAQRRERVFVVGSLGGWASASEILSVREGMYWHSAPRRETREGIAASLTRGADSGGKGGYAGQRREDDVNLVANPLGAKRDGGWRGDLDNDTYVAPPITSNPYGDHESREGLLVARCLNAHPNRSDGESETFVSQLYSIMPQNSGKDYKARPVDVAQPVMAAGPGAGDQGGDVLVTHSLRADGFDASEDGTGRGTPLVAFQANASFNNDTGNEISPSLRSQSTGGSGMPAVALESAAVRRLTPRECERLQGFPDDYTLIPMRGKPAADGPRYRALGNSFAVPVVRWIGQRIQQASA